MIPTLYIYGAIALAGGGGVWYVMDLRSDLAECAVKVEKLGALIDEQNRAVDSLKTASDSARTAAQDAAKQATESQAKAQASDDARRAAIAANKGPQTCSAAISAIRGRP